MTRFTLYLDESGSFDDAEGVKHSLVGGYYCPEPGLDREAAKALLDRVYMGHKLGTAASYHAMETIRRLKSKDATTTTAPGRMKPKDAAAVLSDVMRGVWAPAVAGRPVVTRNRGRGKIVTPHLTYLYLTAECIVSVLRALIRQHGEDVGLTVVIAQRNARAEEYAIPIREHVAVTAYRLALSNLGTVPLDVRVDDARTHPSLMVADHICYGIRSGVMAKGDPSFKNELEQRLLDEVVIENGQSLSLRRSLQDEHYGDAALEAAALASLPGGALAGDARRALEQEIVPGLRALPSRRREYEFRRLFDSVDIRANLQWELARGDALLSLLEQHVMKPMRDIFRGGEAWIDFRFHQLCSRLANHRGDMAAARRHIDQALALAPDVVSRWEMVPLWVDLKLDEAVFLTDACAYERAVAVLDGLHGTLEPLIGALADELKVPAARADVLGSLYGTRLQAHVFAGRRDPGHYARARRDSDAAMAVFVGPQDLDRQFLYRCHLETDAGEVDEALRWLGRALHIRDAEMDLTDVPRCVGTIATALRRGSRQPFHLRHYCRLWTAAAATEAAGSLATAMATAWSEARLADVAQPLKGDEYVHPWEVIDWKAGAALLRAGKPAARERLARATEKCLGVDSTWPLRPPIYAIGLGCLAEWAALEHGTPAAARLIGELRTKTLAMLDDDTGRFPDTMREYFRPWRPVVNPPSPAPEDLLRLAHDVAY